jgi:hypothetical protein
MRFECLSSHGILSKTDESQLDPLSVSRACEHLRIRLCESIRGLVLRGKRDVSLCILKSF